VRAGRSSVDESSFTGEPLPVTKELGVNCISTHYDLRFIIYLTNMTCRYCWCILMMVNAVIIDSKFARELCVVPYVNQTGIQLWF
jgi:hypothetical protein